MTVSNGPSPVGEGTNRVDGREVTPSAALARAVCPYLTGEDGAWRSAVPMREQRCGALSPPAPLTLEKQRRLCLGNAHMTCATYLAARGIEIGATPPSPAAIAARVEDGVTRWALVRTSPLLLDQGRVAGVARLARQRTGAQLALGGLMALALAAIVVARVPRGETESTLAGAASPSPVVLVAPAAPPTPRPTPRPTPTPVPSPVAPSLAPSAAGSGDVNAATASPAVRTYTVQSGDTLYGIAIEFGTSVEAIQAANGMGSSTHLNIGQVLTIP